MCRAVRNVSGSSSSTASRDSEYRRTSDLARPTSTEHLRLPAHRPFDHLARRFVLRRRTLRVPETGGEDGCGGDVTVRGDGRLGDGAEGRTAVVPDTAVTAVDGTPGDAEPVAGLVAAPEKSGAGTVVRICSSCSVGSNVPSIRARRKVFMSVVVLTMPPSAPPSTWSVVSVRSSRPGNWRQAVAVGWGT